MNATSIWQGVTAGVIFGAINFWLLIRIVRGFVGAEKVKPWKTGLFFLAKISLLLLTIGLILKKGYVSPLPFLAGFTVSLIAGISWKAFQKSADSEISGVQGVQKDESGA